LPEKSVRDAAAAAGFAAAAPALRAPFSACCWRPRALPPALAARLRAALLPVELEFERRLVEPVERELEPVLRELELLLRALEARGPDPLARDREEELAPDLAPALRELFRDPPDADDLRDPPEPRPEDDPPPLPPLDSAIALLL
jgi:hypothetical protein